MPRPRRSKCISRILDQISNIGYVDVKQWCLRRLPVLSWAPRYSLRENLLCDTVAGVMLTVQQIAQGLAFAVMSSVHPVFGLYSSVFPPIIYAIFGMGRHVSTGSFAITSLISAGAVERLVPSNTVAVTNGSHGALGLSDFEMQRIGVAAAVTLLGGIVQIYHYILVNIRSVQVVTTLISIFAVIILIVVKECNEHFRSKIRIVIPIDLLLIIVSSLACYFADMETVFGIDVVGPVPKGIPFPQVPPTNILLDVAVEAIGFAVVGYTVSIYLAYNSAKKFTYHVDENQELLAHGLSNVLPSFLFCIPNAAAPARTFLLYSSGSKTQVACLISAIMVLLVIYFIVPYLYWLPMCVLASVIVVALKGMLIQFRDLKKYWNVDKHDWVIWVSTYSVTICFAANVGLLFGVVFSMALGLVRLARARTLNVTRVDEGDKDMHSEIQSNVKCVCVGMPLFFFNAKKFLEEINSKLNARNSIPEHKSNPLLSPATIGTCNGDASTETASALIIDCVGITFFDYTGAAAIAQICLELPKNGTDVLLARCDVSLVKALQYRGFGIKHQLYFDSVKSALVHLQSKQSCSTNLEAADTSDL